MNKKKLWFFVLTTIILTSFISGCIGGGQFGAPSTDSTVTIKGVVVAPDNDCFTDVCANPSITEGEPLPNADIILKGNNGHTLTGKTDCAGNYQISGLTDEGYLLYANRGEVWIKKAISPVTGDGGEANFKTTAQVILWEVVENSFPGSIPIKDIPFAIPFENIPEEFYAAVKAALADCRDAQQDATVIGLAKNYALANFGAPCAPCVEPTSNPQPAPNCPVPTAAIAIPEDLGNGLFQFDASGSNAGRKNLTISKYEWNFGDGETLVTTEPKVQHQYSETGTYQVTLVVVNSCGSSSASVGVRVSYQEVKTYTLTINYVYQGGGQAAPSHTETLAEGASYNVTSPTIPGYTPDQAVVSGTMPASDVTVTVTYTQNVCILADITGFEVTSECSCPTYKSRCPDCENCKECQIIISNVSATGTAPIQYNYGYKKAGSSNYIMSGWTTDNGYTFTSIEECNSNKKYDVIVQVKSDCSTSSYDDFLTKKVTLNGGQCEECCKFDFFSGGGNQKAKWDNGKVKVQFQIKDVCQHERINLKVEVFRKAKQGDWIPHGTDETTFTNMAPNSGGNITIGNEWQSTSITGWESGYSYKFKFTITEAQGYCNGYSETAEGDFSKN